MARYLRTGRATACLDFRRLGMSRRETLRAGALALAGLGLPGLLRAREMAEALCPGVWPCEVVHFDLYVGWAQPARYVGPKA